MIATAPVPLLFTLAAFTAPPKVVVPVLSRVIALKGLDTVPTVLSKLMLPLPVLIVRVSALLLLREEANSTALFVVAKVVLAPKLAAPV